MLPPSGRRGDIAGRTAGRKPKRRRCSGNDDYVLRTSSIPVVLLMSRKSFDKLPAGDIIGKYSCEWLAERYVAVEQANDREVLEQLTTDSRRKVITTATSCGRSTRSSRGSVPPNSGSISGRRQRGITNASRSLRAAGGRRIRRLGDERATVAGSVARNRTA
jgi:hypothetical protein